MRWKKAEYQITMRSSPSQHMYTCGVSGHTWGPFGIHKQGDTSLHKWKLSCLDTGFSVHGANTMRQLKSLAALLAPVWERCSGPPETYADKAECVMIRDMHVRAWENGEPLELEDIRHKAPLYIRRKYAERERYYETARLSTFGTLSMLENYRDKLQAIITLAHMYGVELGDPGDEG